MGDAFCVVIAGARSLATAKGFSETFVPDAGVLLAQNLGFDRGAALQPFCAESTLQSAVRNLAAR